MTFKKYAQLPRSEFTHFHHIHIQKNAVLSATKCPKKFLFHCFINSTSYIRSAALPIAIFLSLALKIASTKAKYEVQNPFTQIIHSCSWHEMRLLMSQNISDNITVKWDESYSYSQDCFTKAINNHIKWQIHIKEHQTQEQHTGTKNARTQFKQSPSW